MSKADISIRETGGLNYIPTDRWVVATGTTGTIEAGEPCKQNASADENVVVLADEDLTIATDQPMAGMSATDSTETTSAAGYVNLYVPLPSIKWEIKADVAASADTQAEIDAFIGNLLLIDVTTSKFTMSLTDGNSQTAAFSITGGNPSRSTVFFRIRPDACSFGRATVA